MGTGAWTRAWADWGEEASDVDEDEDEDEDWFPRASAAMACWRWRSSRRRRIQAGGARSNRVWADTGETGCGGARERCSEKGSFVSWKPPLAGAEGFGAGRACKMIRVTAPMVHRAILCRQYVWKPWASRRSSVFCVSFQRKASKSFPRRPPSSTTRGRKLFPSAAQRLEYLPIFSCAALSAAAPAASAA